MLRKSIITFVLALAWTAAAVHADARFAAAARARLEQWNGGPAAVLGKP